MKYRRALRFIILVTIYSNSRCTCKKIPRQYKNCSQIEQATFGKEEEIRYNVTTKGENRTCIWSIKVENSLKLALTIVWISITPQDKNSGNCFPNKRLEIYEKRASEAQIHTICGNSVTKIPQRTFSYTRDVEVRFITELNETEENVGFLINYSIAPDKSIATPKKRMDMTWLILLLIAIVVFALVIVIIFWSYIYRFKICSRLDSDSDSVFENGPNNQESSSNTRASTKGRNPGRKIWNMNDSPAAKKKEASFTNRQNSDNRFTDLGDWDARPESGISPTGCRLTSLDESWIFSAQLSPSPHDETLFNYSLYSTRRARVLQLPGQQLSPSSNINSGLGGCLSVESLQRRSFYYFNQDKENDSKMPRRDESKRKWRSTNNIPLSLSNSFSGRSSDLKSNADGHFCNTSSDMAKYSHQNVDGLSSRVEQLRKASNTNGAGMVVPKYYDASGQGVTRPPRRLFRYHSADDAIEEIRDIS